MSENQKETIFPRSKRRVLLQGIGAGLAAATLPLQAPNAASGTEQASGATLLALTRKLTALPRQRSFASVEMILTDPDQWDSAALRAIMEYRGEPKQVWDNTNLAGPWLNLMRNALNVQIWAWKRPDFLAISATHGPAHLALYDQTIWDKYRLAALTGGKFTSNTLLEAPSPPQPDGRLEDPQGPFSSAPNSITLLQQRGVVFLACHNAIWELAGTLLKKGFNPENKSHETLAAELTNHLVPGAVLTPGVVGTLPLLQQAGFFYAAAA